MVYSLGWQGIKLCLLLVPYLFGLYSQGGMAQQLLVVHFGAFVTSLVFFVLVNELPECGLTFATRALLLVLSMGNGLATVVYLHA